MADTQTPQGLLAVCRVPSRRPRRGPRARPRLLVVLANVRDPGNAGTVIRAADAAGADAVLVSDGSVDAYDPKVSGRPPGRCSTCRSYRCARR